MNDSAADFDEDAEDGEQSIANLYLIFHLDREEYGIGIQHVTEIVGKQEITRVPNLPGYVKGVINLRGKVIPVIDVRTRFGMPFREYDDRTCSIVINVGALQFGLIVDVVDEVLHIDTENISSPPAMADDLSNHFIQGMGRVTGDGRVKLLLKVECLFKDDEMEQLVGLKEA